MASDLGGRFLVEAIILGRHVSLPWPSGASPVVVRNACASTAALPPSYMCIPWLDRMVALAPSALRMLLWRGRLLRVRRLALSKCEGPNGVRGAHGNLGTRCFVLLIRVFAHIGSARLSALLTACCKI